MFNHDTILTLDETSKELLKKIASMIGEYEYDPAFELLKNKLSDDNIQR